MGGKLELNLAGAKKKNGTEEENKIDAVRLGILGD